MCGCKTSLGHVIGFYHNTWLDRPTRRRLTHAEIEIEDNSSSLFGVLQILDKAVLPLQNRQDSIRVALEQKLQHRLIIMIPIVIVVDNRVCSNSSHSCCCILPSQKLKFQLTYIIQSPPAIIELQGLKFVSAQVLDSFKPCRNLNEVRLGLIECVFLKVSSLVPF